MNDYINRTILKFDDDIDDFFITTEEKNFFKYEIHKLVREIINSPNKTVVFYKESLIDNATQSLTKEVSSINRTSRLTLAKKNILENKLLKLKEWNITNTALIYNLTEQVSAINDILQATLANKTILENQFAELKEWNITNNKIPEKPIDCTIKPESSLYKYVGENYDYYLKPYIGSFINLLQTLAAIGLGVGIYYFAGQRGPQDQNQDLDLQGSGHQDHNPGPQGPDHQDPGSQDQNQDLDLQDPSNQGPGDQDSSLQADDHYDNESDNENESENDDEVDDDYNNDDDDDDDDDEDYYGQQTGRQSPGPQDKDPKGGNHHWDDDNESTSDNEPLTEQENEKNTEDSNDIANMYLLDNVYKDMSAENYIFDIAFFKSSNSSDAAINELNLGKLNFDVIINAEDYGSNTQIQPINFVISLFINTLGCQLNYHSNDDQSHHFL